MPRPVDPKAIVLDAQGGADLRVVLTHLASMFSTPETLAASFARKRSAAVRGVDVALRERHQTQVGNGNVAIDFEAVDAVYHSFTDNAAMAATLLSAAAGLVDHLAADAIEDPSGSTIATAALVLLENPLLEEPDHHWYECMVTICTHKQTTSRLLRSLAAAIMQWPPVLQQRLVHALSRYTPARISTLLHKLQQCVSVYLVQEQRTDTPLEHVVKLIGLLYEANEQGGMLSFTGAG